jgi:hypothetical protein
MFRSTHCRCSALLAAGLILWFATPASAALHATFVAYEVGSAGTFNHQPAAGDFNGDNRVDVVTGDISRRAVVLKR